MFFGLGGPALFRSGYYNRTKCAGSIKSPQAQEWEAIRMAPQNVASAWLSRALFGCSRFLKDWFGLATGVSFGFFAGSFLDSWRALERFFGGFFSRSLLEDLFLSTVYCESGIGSINHQVVECDRFLLCILNAPFLSFENSFFHTQTAMQKTGPEGALYGMSEIRQMRHPRWVGDFFWWFGRSFRPGRSPPPMQPRSDPREAGVATGHPEKRQWFELSKMEKEPGTGNGRDSQKGIKHFPYSRYPLFESVGTANRCPAQKLWDSLRYFGPHMSHKQHVALKGFSQSPNYKESTPVHFENQKWACDWPL